MQNFNPAVGRVNYSEGIIFRQLFLHAAPLVGEGEVSSHNERKPCSFDIICFHFAIEYHCVSCI